ncbi:thiol protease SEN102-like [Coffea arabica]|uniref:Thiol protease SEN102-like n=1 Tax=Coffea arabica TaxID=13443 RepID=A0ABM4WMB1_COFAR
MADFCFSIPYLKYNLQEEMQKLQIDLQDDPYFDIPNSWLKRNPQSILPVWDQGPIGACYAFPLTNAVSALHVIQGGEPVSLAKQEFIDELHNRYDSSHGSLAKDEQKEANQEKEQARPARKRARGKEKQEERNEGKKKRRRISATMEKAFLMIEEYGLYEEDVYPYRAEKDMSFVTPASAVARGQKFFIFGSIVVKDENLSIMEALEHQPIVGTMFSPRSLRKFKGKGIYGGGLLDEIAAEEKRHQCVLIVGSGVNKNGEEFFLIKNSWGED